MESVGRRLRQERLRLGLSQAEFAALGGLKHKTQLNYEADTSSPDANYLLALRENGVDIWYVLTGEITQTALVQDEAELLEDFRRLNDSGKASVQMYIVGCLKTAALVLQGEGGGPERRVRRLAENRRAALDQRTAENVDRAVAEIERVRAERGTKNKG
ncbi:transcriptional regulator [Burkholderia gladioli]|uniref:transcriptional regulator n=1 Tax=Burkholderia gladioli TaxID=28095 RepID=UPI001641E658|nr:transcriptional regulator [Burkholderia gladioli]